MTNSSPPPINIPSQFSTDREAQDYFYRLNNAVYEMWYSLGGQQDGVIFTDRISLDGKTTDDIPEGTTNLYFSGKTTDDLPEGTTNFYYTEARFDTSFSGKTTDDLTQGTTNLYNIFLATPDLVDTTQSDYFYFGWTNILGGWLIRRQDRTDSSSAGADISNNPSYANLTAAWVDRYTLVYA